MIDPALLDNIELGDNYLFGKYREDAHPDFDYVRRGETIGYFNGMNTFLDFITTKYPQVGRDNSSAQVANPGGAFNQFRTYDQAMKTFRKEPHKVNIFDEADIEIHDANERGRTVDYDVTGDFIDMGRYLEGIPEQWGSLYQGQPRNRRVRVLLSIGYGGGFHHEKIAQRSKRLLRVVDSLEMNNIRTQITGIESSQCNHVEITIKNYDEAVSLNDLGVLASPDFLRRPVFRLIEHSDTFSWGYGNSMVFGKAVQRKPEMLGFDDSDELVLMVEVNLNDPDTLFDQLEKLLPWELSKDVPDLSAVLVSDRGLHFKTNGFRPNDEVEREARETIG